MNSVFDVILKPLLSEKAYTAMATVDWVDKDGKTRKTLAKYSFWVHPKANKTLVKNAVQKAFNVKVVSVNVQSVRGKHKKVGRFAGLTAERKKAIVTLAEGQKIDALEGLV